MDALAKEKKRRRSVGIHYFKLQIHRNWSAWLQSVILTSMKNCLFLFFFSNICLANGEQKSAGDLHTGKRYINMPAVKKKKKKLYWQKDQLWVVLSLFPQPDFNVWWWLIRSTVNIDGLCSANESDGSVCTMRHMALYKTHQRWEDVPVKPLRMLPCCEPAFSSFSCCSSLTHARE